MPHPKVENGRYYHLFNEILTWFEAKCQVANILIMLWFITLSFNLKPYKYEKF
ncbi:hypothetical protein BXY75_2000 [Ulvibacter antarcticus]|uniref:Uncharacterized protein n=1 Tax=Ulvibacter antarcticus TaxID=442714 RepID=A0A3L9YD55_9FLAO|nr:hypothetical protein BXY75_2000 [Ulvibacter antarcticus]